MAESYTDRGSAPLDFGPVQGPGLIELACAELENRREFDRIVYQGGLRKPDARIHGDSYGELEADLDGKWSRLEWLIVRVSAEGPDDQVSVALDFSDERTAFEVAGKDRMEVLGLGAILRERLTQARGAIEAERFAAQERAVAERVAADSKPGVAAPLPDRQQPRWWENSAVQVIFVLAALATIVGVVLAATH